MQEFWCYVVAVVTVVGPVVGVLAILATILTVVGGIALAVDKLTEDLYSRPTLEKVGHGFGYGFMGLFFLVMLVGLGAFIYKTKIQVCGLGFKAAYHQVWDQKGK